MVTKEIKDFEEVRTKARAFLCYLLSRNIPNKIPEPSLDAIIAALKKIKKENKEIDTLYILDPMGIQVIDAVSDKSEYRRGKNANKSMRAFYYRAAREKRCILTDPYPSSTTKELIVTASYPLYDENNKLKFIVCLDISLENILKVAHPTSVDSLFGKFNKLMYALFCFALFSVAFLLFFKGLMSIATYGFNIGKLDIKEMFEATILITLSLAIFDLIKTIFEEEVLGKNKKGHDDDIHKTMIRFLGSIIIALSIEALMLVFKFAIMDPEKILYAVFLLIGVTFLLFGLAYYLKSIKKSDQ
jgi:hypothetical protein